jgi:hypothetical protein
LNKRIGNETKLKKFSKWIELLNINKPKALFIVAGDFNMNMSPI